MRVYPAFISLSTSETFSFVLTSEDGSQRFGYCRRLLVTIGCLFLIVRCSKEGDPPVLCKQFPPVCDEEKATSKCSDRISDPLQQPIFPVLDSYMVCFLFSKQ